MNTQMVKNKLAKGLTTGLGVFGSTYVGNAIEKNSSLGSTGVAGSQMVLGAGIAVGSERLGTMLGQRAGQPDGLMELGVEHIGYGIHGAGFAELADEIQTGAQAERMVSVTSREVSDGSQQNNQQAQRASDISLNV